MDALPKFPGFPAEMISFLQGLEKNNHREWFNDHKDEYQKYYLTPASDFTFAFGPRLKRISTGLVIDPALNGSGSLFRIYRDIRFSKDKTPYNTDIRFYFWEGSGKKLENPGYYIQISAEGGRVYAGQYIFTQSLLTVFRDAITDDHLGTELEEILNGILSTGPFHIGGSHFKRVPAGYDPNHPRAEFLKYNGLYLSSELIGRELLLGPEFIDICYEQCVKMAPLHHWLVKNIS